MRYDGFAELTEISKQAPSDSNRSSAEQARTLLGADAQVPSQKSDETKVASLSGLVDWVLGRKKEEKPSPIIEDKPSGIIIHKEAPPPVEPKASEPIKIEDPFNPSADAIKVFEEKKAEIKEACEKAYGAGNEKCDDTKSVDKHGVVPTDRSSTSHNSGNSGLTNALILWWLMSSNNRTSTAPNYYDHKQSDRNNFIGTTPTRRDPQPAKPAQVESHSPANTGKNPVTGIPNTGSRPATSNSPASSFKPSGSSGGGYKPSGGMGGARRR